MTNQPQREGWAQLINEIINLWLPGNFEFSLTHKATVSLDMPEWWQLSVSSEEDTIRKSDGSEEMNATQDHRQHLPSARSSEGFRQQIPTHTTKLHLRCSTNNLYRLVVEVRRQPYLPFFNLLYLLRQAFLGVQITQATLGFQESLGWGYMYIATCLPLSCWS